MNDISDILASVSRPTRDPRLLDLQALTRAWINERGAPELLPYPTLLIERITARIQSQIESIEAMASTMEPSSNLRLVVLQTELERVKFLVRSFLRARIAKVSPPSLRPLTLPASLTPPPSIPLPGVLTLSQMDEYPHHHLSTPASSLLSPLEQQYLTAHTSLLSSHYSAAFLAAFPPSLRKMDDHTGGITMVDAPDADSAVFVRVLRDCGRLEVQGEDGSSAVDLRSGDVWVVRWRGVRDRVHEGDIELI